MIAEPRKLPIVRRPHVTVRRCSVHRGARTPDVRARDRHGARARARGVSVASHAGLRQSLLRVSKAKQTAGGFFERLHRAQLNTAEYGPIFGVMFLVAALSKTGPPSSYTETLMVRCGLSD